jgi:transcriptional regulator with XRE-family HTH domain
VKAPRLREWREAMGATQAALSESSGLSEFTIIRVEHGESLRPSTAKKLADTLGISVIDLMDSPPVPAGKAEAPATGQVDVSKARGIAEAATNAVFEAFGERLGEPQPKELEVLGGILGDWAWAMYEAAAGGTPSIEQEEFARRLSEGLLSRVREEREASMTVEQATAQAREVAETLDRVVRATEAAGGS